MGQLIHTKHTPDGVRFRLWSTNGGEYVTREMTEAETREYTLKLAVCQAIERHNREIDGHVQQAISNGTSSMIGDSRDPNADWDKPLNPKAPEGRLVELLGDDIPEHLRNPNWKPPGYPLK